MQGGKGFNGNGKQSGIAVRIPLHKTPPRNHDHPALAIFVFFYMTSDLTDLTFHDAFSFVI